MSKERYQADKVIDVVRNLDCDKDEGRWEKRLKRVAGHKPAPGNPE